MACTFSFRLRSAVELVGATVDMAGVMMQIFGSLRIYSKFVASYMRSAYTNLF